jgi:hypothetical protein
MIKPGSMPAILACATSFSEFARAMGERRGPCRDSQAFARNYFRKQATRMALQESFSEVRKQFVDC